MKRKIIPYDPRLKDAARHLRNNATPAEIALWQHLQSKQRKGSDFHRQKPLESFIVDFYCSELSLAIEIDGITHVGKEANDMARQRRLESFGVRFLRFLDSDVRYNTQGVVSEIESWIDEHLADSPDMRETE